MHLLLVLPVLVPLGCFALSLVLLRRPVAQRALGVVGAAGLLAAGLALFAAEPFLEGRWGGAKLPGLGRPGTPLLFDVGVYFVVLGTVLTVVLSLLEVEE